MISDMTPADETILGKAFLIEMGYTAIFDTLIAGILTYILKDYSFFLGLRSEHIHSRTQYKQEAQNHVATEVIMVENMGNEVHVHFTAGPHQYVARMDPAIQVRAGDIHDMWFDARHVHLFDRETGDNLIPGPENVRT